MQAKRGNLKEVFNPWKELSKACTDSCKEQKSTLCLLKNNRRNGKED